MYDELILKLRKDAEFLEISSKYNNIKNEFAERISQAADVIEELSNAGSIYGKAWTLGYDAGRDENRPRWIPVTERLPDSMHEYVLCCGENGGQFVGWIAECMIESGKARAFQHGGRGRNITHWMPLPEPPEKEKT